MAAIAWQEAGLIDMYCDIGHWERRIADEDEEKWPDACGRIRQGMAALGLPIYGPGEHQPEIMTEHRSCIEAPKMAQEIHRRMDNPGTAVMRFHPACLTPPTWTNQEWKCPSTPKQIPRGKN